MRSHYHVNFNADTLRQHSGAISQWDDIFFFVSTCLFFYRAIFHPQWSQHIDQIPVLLRNASQSHFRLMCYHPLTLKIYSEINNSLHYFMIRSCMCTTSDFEVAMLQTACWSSLEWRQREKWATWGEAGKFQPPPPTQMHSEIFAHSWFDIWNEIIWKLSLHLRIDGVQRGFIGVSQ